MMLMDALVAIGLLMMMITGVVIRPLTTEPNMVAAIALYHQFTAVYHRQHASFKVTNGVIESEQVGVSFSDCHLRFHPNGNASQSGTCYSDTMILSLRPGEGGIGYPW